MQTTCTSCGAEFEARRDGQRLCFACWRAAPKSSKHGCGNPASGAASAGAIDSKRLRQLLQLCHPDKHGGSKTATDVTAWLNSLKGAR